MYIAWEGKSIPKILCIIYRKNSFLSNDTSGRLKIFPFFPLKHKQRFLVQYKKENLVLASAAHILKRKIYKSTYIKIGVYHDQERQYISYKCHTD